jgi:hypothetical protein
MDYTTAKKYIVTTAFCFNGTKVHIQTLPFSTAQEALEHLETDNARSEKWKAEGTTIFNNQILSVHTYEDSGYVNVFHMQEAELRKQAEAEKKKGEVS